MIELIQSVGEAICIGDSIRIVITDAGTDRVRLGISAPAEVPILRGELVAPQEHKPGKRQKLIPKS